MTQDIDVSTLSAEGAVRLRALFEASASAARQGGQEAEAEEGFLIALAGLMDEYLKGRVATGEPMPKPVSINTTGNIVNTAKLTVKDAHTGATFLVGAAERFEAEGFPTLAAFFVATAEALAAVVRQKTAPTGGAIH
jgi:hypothetical protein